MQDLTNEIRKQIEYAGQGGTITTKSIDLLAIKQLDSVYLFNGKFRKKKHRTSFESA